MQELTIDKAELRAQMGRGNVSQRELAVLADVHYNTIWKVLKTGTADLETIAAITRGLNIALEREEQRLVAPFDLMRVVGFPSPQMAAQALQHA